MAQFASLVDILAHRAATQGDERALVFLTDRGAEDSVLTFRELHDAANALAQRLAQTAKPGDRALLVFPPGLEFVIAFFGCLIARVIAVPMMVPRRQSARDSSASIMANCKPVLALTSPALAARGDLAERFAGHDLQWITVDLTPGTPGEIALPRPQSGRRRVPAIHLRLDLRPEGRRRHARDAARQHGDGAEVRSAPASTRPASTGCRSITTWG